MPGWPRLPREARSLRTWASDTPRASPSWLLEMRVPPSRSRLSRRRRYRLNRPTLARDSRGSPLLPPPAQGSPALLMLPLTIRTTVAASSRGSLQSNPDCAPRDLRDEPHAVTKPYLGKHLDICGGSRSWL